MSEDNKKAWCGLDGFKPVAHHADYSGAAYIAPITLNDGAWDKIKETMRNAKPSELYSFDADGSVIHKKEPAPFYTEEDVRKLQSERNDLAATVEALQGGIREIMINIGAGATMSEICEMVYIMESGFSATPQQHLRDVRAEAGRAGFIEGYDSCWFQHYGTRAPEHATAYSADQYAASVKAGVE